MKLSSLIDLLRWTQALLGLQGYIGHIKEYMMWEQLETIWTNGESGLA